MDYREKSFRSKFAGAAQYLGVPPEQIVSLKLRDNVSSSEYRRLVDILHHEVGLQFSEIQADLQGHGYLLEDGQNRVIVVEHETGLELLYVASSIATLVMFVPFVLQVWRSLRGQFPGRHGHDHELEIRRIDSSGHLYEEHIHKMYLGSSLGMESFLPITEARLIGMEIKILSEQIQKLDSRVETLEKQRRTPTASRQKAHSPSETKKKRPAKLKEPKP